MPYICLCGHKVVIIKDEKGERWEHGGFGLSSDYKHQKDCTECKCKNPKEYLEGISWWSDIQMAIATRKFDRLPKIKPVV